MFKAIARFWRYLVALVTRRVEQLEDPDVLLDQARREMNELLARNRERAIQAITQKNLLQAEAEKLGKVVRDLERKAELALKQGNRDLALQLVREKKAQEAALTTLRASLEQATQTVEAVKMAIRRQEEEVRARTAQALALKARWRQAQIQTEINKALDGLTLESMESSWEVASEKIQRAEAEAQARQEVAASSVQGRIAQLETAQVDQEAEEELLKMEERLGLRKEEVPVETTATQTVQAGQATETPQVPESDVLKELEELEKKLQTSQGQGEGGSSTPPTSPA